MSTISLRTITLGASTEAQATAAFEDYIRTQVFPEEGAYSDDPNDSGGETAWGVDEAEARAVGYKGDMKAMTQADALEIYRHHDWTAPGFDRLALVNLPLALALLDLGINMGDQTVTKFLQTLLQVLGYYGGTIDGFIGPVSTAGVAKFLAARGLDGLRVLYCGVHAAAGMRYVAIVQGQPKNKDFIYGWLSNRAYPAISA
jgi:lysozyme family protein